jgi:hypothetical protein
MAVGPVLYKIIVSSVAQAIGLAISMFQLFALIAMFYN